MTGFLLEFTLAKAGAGMKIYQVSAEIQSSLSKSIQLEFNSTV